MYRQTFSYISEITIQITDPATGRIKPLRIPLTIAVEVTKSPVRVTYEDAGKVIYIDPVTSTRQ